MSRKSQPVFSLVLATYGRADVLEPLIEGLKARGICFATLRDHPLFAAAAARAAR